MKIISCQLRYERVIFVTLGISMDVNFDLFDEEVRREIARRSLHEFIQYINPEYITSHFSQTVCDALDQFLIDMMAGKRLN